MTGNWQLYWFIACPWTLAVLVAGKNQADSIWNNNQNQIICDLGPFSWGELIMVTLLTSESSQIDSIDYLLKFTHTLQI